MAIKLRYRPSHTLHLRLAWIAALAGADFLAGPAFASTARSYGAKTEFQHWHPCPLTGKISHALAGYVKDHIMPLSVGRAPASVGSSS